MFQYKIYENFISVGEKLYMLYTFFWVNPRRLKFICRRFGTLCSIFIGRWVRVE